MSFWKPGTVAPGSSIDRDGDSSAAEGGAGSSVGAITGRVAHNISVAERRYRLPIAKQKDALLYLLEHHPVVVLQSPTGTGKSTQLPQFLLEAGWASEGKSIGITQPRRVAAVSVAQRVAEEVGSVLGDQVGYSIRFEALCNPETKILFLTDGMLFREILLDPLLSKYSVIMVDEAHERSTYTDLLLGVLKKIRRVRPSLRIIISSATIDAQSFVDYFNTFPPSSSVASSGINPKDDSHLPPPAKRSRWDDKRKPAKSEAVMVRLEGKSYPVDIAYLDEPAADLVLKVVETVFDIHLKYPPGDILVFLTGRDEIDRCLQQLADNMNRMPSGAADLRALPLHSGLSTEAQMAVFQPPPSRTRKVIVSTNVAEASVTIDGIKYVIDSGLVKLKSFNPLTGMDALVTTPCSIASLQQRAGRAGRTSPGKCFRLFPSSVLPSLLPTTPPELTRSDLSLVVLQLRLLGIQNVLRFDWMNPPSSAMLERALEFLFCLGALDDEGKLTKPLGERMAEMPIDCMMAKIVSGGVGLQAEMAQTLMRRDRLRFTQLLDSAEFGCSNEILTIAAMSSVQHCCHVSQNVFIMDEGDSVRHELERRKFIVEEGDHLTHLNVYNAFVKHGRKASKWCHTHRLNFKALSRALSIRTQLKKYLQRFEIPLISCGTDHAKVRRCLTSGYFRNCARVQPDGTYRSVRENALLHVHPSSVMFTRTPLTPYVIYHEVIETTKRFMRDVTSIEVEWLTELAPHYYSFKKTESAV
ncbi:BZ3500_MvSof-1268-A1-R1_Chr4-3g07374 [Microbotryum saponariae]|uniref:RNA helicase n=1 Tax=Microbotryum saponariae TaxID=289078 RepID=A0A2X0KU49_9BASI|nr:BZ3500_MvSof-1268-A1-R1_Chr4-3g07374 [Microbotryum saponariae]SDA07037.1 BZ3501_MvSof-1269-A2-R1_Chr4-2g07083 [Microbotryum saponariae]